MDSKQIGLVIIESQNASLPAIVNRDNDGYIKFNTVLQSTETENRNKRIYSEKSLRDGLTTPNMIEKIKKKNFVGECGHPLTTDVDRQTYVEFTNVSHIITKINFNGNIIEGEVETYNGFKGPSMMGAVRQGVGIGFSLRALCNATKTPTGIARVDGPLLVISYDWVFFPSHKEAYMKDGGLNPHSNSMAVREGTDQLLEFNINEMLTYLGSKSDNIQCLSESFEVDLKDTNNIILGKDKGIYLKQDTNMVKCFLEDSIKKEIDNFLLNL